MNKKFIIISLLISIFVVATITISSYAYFTIANKEGDENVITSGTMTLNFADGNEITANGLLPGQYIEKEFAVENTGNVDTRYDIYLSEVVNTFVDKTDLVYEITSTDDGYQTINPTQIQVPDSSTKIIDSYPIEVGAIHHYKLKITFLNKDENQNDNQGKVFSAKIQVNEYKDTISFNVLTTALSNDIEIEINFGNALVKEYSIGNQNDYQTYNGTIHLRSNDHYSLANQDGTITIYARTIDLNGNEVIISKDIDNLDILVPTTPIINASSGYPVIYDTGVKFDDTLNIQFDERNGITNEVSLDNGLTWNEYTGNEHIESGVIKARSVSPTGIISESSKMVSIQNNAIGANAYDISSNRDTTAFYASEGSDNEYFIDIDNSAIGKNLRIKQYTLNNVNYNCTMSFIDESGNDLTFKDVDNNSYTTFKVNKDVDNIYIIPNNAKKIKFSTHSLNDANKVYIWRVYDINIKKDPILNVSRIYPTITNNSIEMQANINIDYYEYSTIKQYKINDGLWQNYNGTVKINIGDTIYAKSIDNNNVESFIVSYKYDYPNDAVGLEAFDTSNNKDNTAFYATEKVNMNYYIDIESSAIGKNLRIKQYAYNNGNYDCTMSIIDENGNNLAFKDINNNSYTTFKVNKNVDNTYIIPQNAKRIKFYTHSLGDANKTYLWRVYDVSLI